MSEMWRGVGRIIASILSFDASHLLNNKNITPLFLPLPPTLRARLYYVTSSLTLVSLITVAVVLRPFWATLNDYSSYYCDVFGPSRSLRTWLAHEEARYAVAIQGRLELIKQGLLIPDFQYPHRVQSVGTSCDGGKWVCGLGRPAKQARTATAILLVQGLRCNCTD
ncbi:hypothetical protein EDB89DRAFT_1512194 [Lactarius sanguifluus]|nr:hypothetical protein EDB89DRAFT_1512194 [Lactarius sanguifluus]